MNRKWLIGGGVAIGVLLLARGAQALEQPDVLPMLDASLDAGQKAAAATIQSVVLANIPEATPEVLMAFIANAYRESQLDPRAKGDNRSGSPHSFGLFQLNLAGLGSGLDPNDMMDATFCTQTIIDRGVFSRYGSNFMDAAGTPGTSAQSLAAIFCRDIERPANSNAQMQASRDAVSTIFGV